jgi:hypothetical protein
MATMRNRGILLLFFLIFIPLTLSAQEHRCLVCHGKQNLKAKDLSGKERSLYVNTGELTGSAHGKLVCVDCHLDVSELPHPKRLKKVDCAACHSKGKTFEQGPTIEYSLYRDSVHARERQKGNQKAPDCVSCHGSHDTLNHTDLRSKGYRLNIPDRMCGKCHKEVLTEYRSSIHGAISTKGDINLPICTDCHTEHGIRKIADPSSTVYAANIVGMCVKCHGDFAIMKQYGKNTEEVATYYETFHGVAVKFGEMNIAHCASCHGYHAIKPQKDATSSINLANIPKTCGQPKCHPGATANFGKGKMHVNPQSKESGIIYYVSFGFKWLTITVLLLLFVHIFLDFLRKLQEKKKKRI